MFNKTKNQNKGITLIALVITIIVLLILAGISISMLSGDNSIISRAGEAKDKTEIESLKEEVKIVMSNRTIEKTTMGINSKTLKQDLDSGIKNGEVEEITKADGITKYTDVCYVSKNGKSITVYENGEVEEGKVSIWKGATDIECPEFKKDENNVWNWYIYTAGQLKFLADFVNNGNSLNGTGNGADLTSYVTRANYNPSSVTMTYNTKVYLMNNIDLGARPGVGATEEEKWETGANEAIKWIPIGNELSSTENSKSFICKFEGNNYAIRNVYVNEVNSENGNAGLFSGSTMSVTNLILKKSYIKGKLTSGGIATVNRGRFEGCKIVDSYIISTESNAGGIVGSSWGRIINCSNENTYVYGIYYIGGIIGQKNSASSEVENCKNTGNINGKAYVGGIVGQSRIELTIKKCINEGRIKCVEECAGGIIGYFRIENSNAIECINNGEIEGKNAIGGIVGDANISTTIRQCKNNGFVKGNKNISGIVGVMGYKTKVEECNNSGQVIGKTEYTGGIVGLIATDKNDPSDKEQAVVCKCFNSGNIQGKNDTGGIIGGACQYNSLIEKCYNLGEVKGTNFRTGGIAGSFGRSSKIYNCYNMNKVTGAVRVGGIAGNSYNSACEIKNCYNIGNISGTTLLGGILGKNDNSSTIANSYYLEGTATLDEGSGSANNLAKNKEFITQDFVTTANTTETIWKVEAGKNDGWPILNE